MQNAGVAFPVSPAGHVGSGACVAALALAPAVADEEAAGELAEGCAGALIAADAEADVAAVVPFAASLSQATTASRKAETVVIRMGRRIRAYAAPCSDSSVNAPTAKATGPGMGEASSARSRHTSGRS
jgi:hypothetical protein